MAQNDDVRLRKMLLQQSAVPVVGGNQKHFCPLGDQCADQVPAVVPVVPRSIGEQGYFFTVQQG